MWRGWKASDMGLPWVRLDANIGQHDKVLLLKSQPNGWRAFGVYILGLAWSGGQGTDGLIPSHVLPAIDATPKIAAQLVDVRLWEHASDGAYQIRNWDIRQELNVVTEINESTRRRSSAKANCVRWHGPKCECWRTAYGDTG